MHMCGCVHACVYKCVCTRICVYMCVHVCTHTCEQDMLEGWYATIGGEQQLWLKTLTVPYCNQATPIWSTNANNPFVLVPSSPPTNQPWWSANLLESGTSLSNDTAVKLLKNLNIFVVASCILCLGGGGGGGGERRKNSDLQ